MVWIARAQRVVKVTQTEQFWRVTLAVMDAISHLAG